MRQDEEKVISGILLPLALKVSVVFGWAEMVLSDSMWELGVPSPSDPQVSGARSEKRQALYIKQGKSWWRGSLSDAPHVQRRAIHLILRHRVTGRAYFYEPESKEPMQQEANAAFLVIVERMERQGWTWGGRWGNSDPNHFQWDKKGFAL